MFKGLTPTKPRGSSRVRAVSVLARAPTLQAPPCAPERVRDAEQIRRRGSWPRPSPVPRGLWGIEGPHDPGDSRELQLSITPHGANRRRPRRLSAHLEDARERRGVERREGQQVIEVEGKATELPSSPGRSATPSHHCRKILNSIRRFLLRSFSLSFEATGRSGP